MWSLKRAPSTRLDPRGEGCTRRAIVNKPEETSNLVMPLQRDCEIPPSDTTRLTVSRYVCCSFRKMHKLRTVQARGKRIRLPADRQVVFLEENSIQTLDTCTGPPGRQGAQQGGGGPGSELVKVNRYEQQTIEIALSVPSGPRRRRPSLHTTREYFEIALVSQSPW